MYGVNGDCENGKLWEFLEIMALMDTFIIKWIMGMGRRITIMSFHMYGANEENVIRHFGDDDMVVLRTFGVAKDDFFKPLPFKISYSLLRWNMGYHKVGLKIWIELYK